MRSILRLVLFCGILAGLMLLGDSLVLTPLIGAVVAGLAFWLFWDFLGFFENVGFLDAIRRFLFWVCMIAAFGVGFIATYQELFYEGNYFLMDSLSKSLVLGSMPSVIATLWLASIVDYYDTGRIVGVFVMVGGLVIGAVVGFALSFLTSMGPVALLAISAIVSIVGLVFLFKFYKRNGWIMASVGSCSTGSYSSSSSSTRTRSSSSSSSYSGSSYSSSSYGEGSGQLDYYMQDLAYKHSTSRSLPYGLSIRSDVNYSHYGDDAYFTVDFTLDTSCCSTDSTHEYNMAIREAQSFQKEVMNDLFREGKSLISRIKSKYSDFDGVNFEVKVGNVYED